MPDVAEAPGRHSGKWKGRRETGGFSFAVVFAKPRFFGILIKYEKI